MARRKPEWLQKREYDKAVARNNYYENRTPSQSTTVTPRKQISAIYASYLLSTATDPVLFVVPASEPAVIFFGTSVATGLTALGLRTDAQVLTPVGKAPRNFKPAKVHAMIGTTIPTAKINPWGSRVIKYSANTTGTAQAHYSAPVSSGDNNPTIAEVDAKVEAIKTSNNTAIANGSAYGRLYWTPEITSLGKEVG